MSRRSLPLATRATTGGVPFRKRSSSSSTRTAGCETATQAVGAPFVMIFDDFHYLDEAPDDVRETVEGWLYRLPENCHVIISGRTQPQLGVLPIMSVRQEVDRITMGDRINDVQNRKIRHEVCDGGCNPSHEAVSDMCEAAQVIREAADHKQRKRKYRGEKRC